MIWVALAILAIGLLLILNGKAVRRRHGLGTGRAVAINDRTLYSARYGLAGRPDYIRAAGAFHIPEEVKSAKRVYASHRAQLAVYFILIEEETGIEPPHGFIITGDGQRHQILNTSELRAWVLGIAEEIRAMKRQLAETIRVSQPAAKCRACGMRERCRQRSG